MRKFWIGLIGLIFVSGLVLTQTPIVNKQIAPTREILLRQIEATKGFVQTIGEKSGTVTKSDLSQLQKMVYNFFSLKERLLEEIDDSSFVFTENDAPEIAFIFECGKALNEYFNSDSIMWYKDDNAQTIKRFFVKYTGREMRIEPGKEWPIRIILIGIIVGFFIALIIGGIFHWATDKNGYVGWIVGVIVFIIWLLVSLFVL